VNQNLGQLSRFGQIFHDLKERFNSVLIELNDISATLEAEDNQLEVDFDKLTNVTDRLSRIYQLQQKHGVDTVEKLIEIESDLADKAFQIGNLDEELAKLQQETDASWKELLTAGRSLSEKRRASYTAFASNIMGLLAQLGMENASIEVVGRNVEPTATGTDEIEIMFSANKGIKP